MGQLNYCPTEGFGLLSCVSSQDDRPACFVEPWGYEGDWLNAKSKVMAYLRDISGLRFISGGDDELTETSAAPISKDVSSNRYIRVEISDTANTAKFIDEYKAKIISSQR